MTGTATSPATSQKKDKGPTKAKAVKSVKIRNLQIYDGVIQATNVARFWRSLCKFLSFVQGRLSNEKRTLTFGAIMTSWTADRAQASCDGSATSKYEH